MGKGFRSVAGVVCSIALLFVLAGCTNINYQQGSTRPADKSLVFGRMLLVRDGVSSPMAVGTSIRISKITATGEPPIVMNPFTEDGHFYWLLGPGQYRLTIPLHITDQFAFSFIVPKTPGVYYFGELLFRGKKHFDTLTGANIKDVTAVFEDHFDTEKAALLKRDPQLAREVFGRLKVFNMSGNAGRQRVLHQVLADAPLCCTQLSDAHYQPLNFDTSATYEIKADRGAYAFTSGRSFFVAFSLPRYTAPYTISLRSEAMSNGMPGEFRIFVPAAMLLDAHFKPLKRIDVGLTHPVPASLFPPRSVSMFGRIAIDGATARARYLVLYTTDGLLGLVSHSSVPGVLPVPGGVLPLGFSQTVGLDPWITGKVHISLDLN